MPKLPWKDIPLHRKELPPWGEMRRRIATVDEVVETKIYRDSLEVERAQRLKIFTRGMAKIHSKFLAMDTMKAQSKLHKKQLKFQAAEDSRQIKLMALFIGNVKRYGIDHVRATTVPAYTFPRFGKLPLEIQCMIWSISITLPEPDIQIFMPQRPTTDFNSIHTRLHRRTPTPLYFNLDFLKSRKTPVCLQVCRTSRQEALKAFIPIRGSTYDSFQHQTPKNTRIAYFNAQASAFYFGRNHWSNFHLLVQLMAKSNLPGKEICPCYRELTRIQSLVVDLNIFGELPVKLWAEFPELKKLVVVFFPFHHLSNSNGINCIRRVQQPVLKIPRKDSILGIRASKIHKAATEAFENLKQKLPAWETPEIQVKVMASFTTIPSWKIEEEGVNENDCENKCVAKNEESGPSSDNAWLSKLPEMMNHSRWEDSPYGEQIAWAVDGLAWSD